MAILNNEFVVGLYESKAGSLREFMSHSFMKAKQDLIDDLLKPRVD